MTLRVRNATKTGCGRDILPTDWIYVFAKQGHFLIGHVRREGLIQFQNLLTPWILWGGSRTIEDSVWHYCRSCCTNVITKAQGSYFSRHWFSFKKVIHDLLIGVAIMMRTTSSRKRSDNWKTDSKIKGFLRHGKIHILILEVLYNGTKNFVLIFSFFSILWIQPLIYKNFGYIPDKYTNSKSSLTISAPNHDLGSFFVCADCIGSDL